MSELTKEELKALKKAQQDLFKKKKTVPRDTMLYKGDPILNKYMKRGGGYDFSNITKKDREYLGLKKEVQKLYSGEGRATMEDGYEVEQAVEAVFELEAFLRDFIS